MLILSMAFRGIRTGRLSQNGKEINPVCEGTAIFKKSQIARFMYNSDGVSLLGSRDEDSHKGPNSNAVLVKGCCIWM